MSRIKSVLDGHWTVDPFTTRCACGAEIHRLRRGAIALLPSGHGCRYREMQEAVMRTIRAEESVGLRVTPSKAAQRLLEVLS